MTALRVVKDFPAASELDAQERIIARGLRSFVEVGEALAYIRDNDLYKENFTTFEEYCRERWDLKRSYAYETIEASRTVRALSGIPDTHIPTNPGQARELSGLEPGEAQEVMEAAHEATGGKITAKAIKEARQAYEADDTPPVEQSDEEHHVAHLHANERKIRELLDEYLQVPHFDFTDHNFQRVTALLQGIQDKARRIEETYHEQRNQS